MSASDRIDSFHAVAISDPDGLRAINYIQQIIADKLGIAPDAVDTHQYVSWLKAEKQTITRDQVVALLHELGLTSQAGIERYVVIHNAHELTSEAANALLKTLEEPPAAVWFYLTTPSAARLLPTIRSRVVIQGIKGTKSPTDNEDAELLQQRTQANLFLDNPLPARFAQIAQLPDREASQAFISTLVDLLRQREEYAILAWIQNRPLSRTAPNYRLFLETLAVSEVLG